MVTFITEEERERSREELQGEFTFCKGCYSCSEPCEKTTKDKYKEEIENKVIDLEDDLDIDGDSYE